jgi:hypothetical protein
MLRIVYVALVWLEEDEENDEDVVEIVGSPTALQALATWVASLLVLPYKLLAAKILLLCASG